MNLNKFLFMAIIIITVVISVLVGYAVGYYTGIKDTVNYGISIVDKIHIDNFTVELNQSKIDSLVDELRNMSIGLRDQVQESMWPNGTIPEQSYPKIDYNLTNKSMPCWKYANETVWRCVNAS